MSEQKVLNRDGEEPTGAGGSSSPSSRIVRREPTLFEAGTIFESAADACDHHFSKVMGLTKFVDVLCSMILRKFSSTTLASKDAKVEEDEQVAAAFRSLNRGGTSVIVALDMAKVMVVPKFVRQNIKPHIVEMAKK